MRASGGALHAASSTGRGGPFALTSGAYGVQMLTPGRPAGVFLARRILEVDTIAAQVVIADTFEYVGSPIPEREVSLASTASVWRRIRLYGLLDGRSGFRVFNWTAMHRDLIWRNSEAWVRREELPAAERLRRFGPSDSFTLNSPVRDNYTLDGSFIRLRELSVTFDLPGGWASRLGATAASLTLAGRNLALWTDYEGPDPEVLRDPGSPLVHTDSYSPAQARRWNAGLTVQF